jgi:NAD(P)-dependent dehydrogenase (short-subunit alcohol dehydrogenase family)
MKKIILITGATDGIGKATAKALLLQKHKVILHGRSATKVQQTINELKELTGSNEMDSYVCDLSDLRLVKQMAAEIKTKYNTLDVLINNAGAMLSSKSITNEGHEMMFAINYLAVVVLTENLLPLLKATPNARIVNLSSVSYKTAKPNFEDLSCDKEYDMMKQYGNTKLYDLYYTLDLAEKLKGTTVTVNAAHPGGVRTQLARDFKGSLKYIFAIMMPLFFTSVEKGASTSVHLATSTEVAGESGGYYVKSKLEAIKEIGLNAENRKQLSSKTTELIGQYL